MVRSPRREAFLGANLSTGISGWSLGTLSRNFAQNLRERLKNIRIVGKRGPACSGLSAVYFDEYFTCRTRSFDLISQLSKRFHSRLSFGVLGAGSAATGIPAGHTSLTQMRWRFTSALGARNIADDSLTAIRHIDVLDRDTLMSALPQFPKC
jgi:hypothetical protein